MSSGIESNNRSAGLKDLFGALQDYSGIIVPQAALAAVTYIERVRAICAMAQVGNAGQCKHSAAAVKAAANSLRSGDAFAGNVYADDVSVHVALNVDS
jgi:hypothetical protein